MYFERRQEDREDCCIARSRRRIHVFCSCRIAMRQSDVSLAITLTGALWQSRTEVREEMLSQYHSVHYKSLIWISGIELQFLRWEAGEWPPGKTDIKLLAIVQLSVCVPQFQWFICQATRADIIHCLRDDIVECVPLNVRSFEKVHSTCCRSCRKRLKWYSPDHVTRFRKNAPGGLGDVSKHRNGLPVCFGVRVGNAWYWASQETFITRL